MAEILRDDIDWEAYEAATHLQVKVRPASMFEDDLVQRFKPKLPNARRPRMLSTKLGPAIEFRPGETTVWAGYNGSRKSMLVGQSVLDLLRLGERVMVASFEMSPAETLERMARQFCDVATPSESQIREFSRWTNGKLWLFDHVGTASPIKVLAVIRYFGEHHEGHHVVIDSMMMVVSTEDSMDESKRFVTELVRCGIETRQHVHLVAHCRKPSGSSDESKPPSKYDIKGTSAISDQAHNVILVWANKAKKATLALPGVAFEKREEMLEQPDALVIVDKQRNGSFEGKLKLWWDENTMRFRDDRTAYTAPFETF